MDNNSELRQDIVSGDWVLVVHRTDRKPKDFKQKKGIKRSLKSTCPFENPRKAGGGNILFIHPNEKNWKLAIVPNKYPVVTQAGEWALEKKKYGPFRVIPGFGHHELMITRDHDNNFPKLSKNDAFLVFKSFRERYRILSEDNNISYITMFHNWGPRAGASIYHPHYQILAIPVVPPDAKHSLHGSDKYFKKHKKCVHCVQIAWEKKQKTRIICENKDIIVFAPYTSKEPFEMRVFPKKHLPYFEDTTDTQLKAITNGIQHALKKLEKFLGHPGYNVFIHTAPVKDKDKYGHYHWHIEIIPRLNISAGFELSTSIEVNSTDPDIAARLLNNA